MSAHVPAHGRFSRLAPQRALHASLMLCALVLAGCKGGGGEAQAKPGEEPKGPDAVPVEVVKAALRPIAASYTGTAALEPRGESQVVAKTSGVAQSVMVEEGQTVRAGQALVRLDSDRSRLAVAQAQAQMQKLENNYRRAQQLVTQQMISANDVDQIKYDLENARAQYHMAQLENSYTTVVAPISGVIASRSIKTGNFVQINTPIFRIVDDSRMEVTLDVPEREISTLKAGQPVSLAVDALPGQTFTGTVDRIAPVVDSGSGTFRVVSAFEGGGLLQPGMFGRIKIDYDQRADALVIPRVALLDDEGDPAVFVVRNGKAVRVPVKLGYMDGEWVEIREGLKLGEGVVTAGKIALRDSTPVEVIGQNAPKTAAKKVEAKAAGSKQ